MKIYLLIFIVFSTSKVCLSSFPSDRENDSFYDQSISWISHQMIDESNNPTLWILVLGLLGGIIWLFSKASKSTDPEQKKFLNKTAGALSFGLNIFLILFLPSYYESRN